MPPGRRGRGLGPGPGRGPGRGARRATRRRVRRVRRRTRRRRILVGGAVVLMVGGAYSSYKLSKQDVEQVEQHTGKSAEDLTEEELEAAMDDLGIQDQELTAEDEAAIEAEAV
ncbi:MAG: hypothetical protein R3335_09635 [Anaerolineales bacterium]|nr:hypothetical protein [Anaerolineales bacterium]